MNKTLLSAALIAGFGIAALAPQTARAVNSGTINITGTILASSCVVNINGAAAGAVTPITLPSQVAGNLAAGASSSWTPLTITLTGCTAIAGYTSVYPYFSGAGIDGATGYLKNSGTSNVEVALSNSQGLGANALTLQNASGSQNAGTQLLSAATPTFSYYAGYAAPVAASATAGSVTTTVQYALNYQ